MVRQVRQPDLVPHLSLVRGRARRRSVRHASVSHCLAPLLVRLRHPRHVAGLYRRVQFRFRLLQCRQLLGGRLLRSGLFLPSLFGGRRDRSPGAIPQNVQRLRAAKGLLVERHQILEQRALAGFVPRHVDERLGFFAEHVGVLLPESVDGLAEPERRIFNSLPLQLKDIPGLRLRVLGVDRVQKPALRRRQPTLPAQALARVVHRGAERLVHHESGNPVNCGHELGRLLLGRGLEDFFGDGCFVVGEEQRLPVEGCLAVQHDHVHVGLAGGPLLVWLHIAQVAGLNPDGSHLLHGAEDECRSPSKHHAARDPTDVAALGSDLFADIPDASTFSDRRVALGIHDHFRFPGVLVHLGDAESAVGVHLRDHPQLGRVLVYVLGRNDERPLRHKRAVELLRKYFSEPLGVLDECTFAADGLREPEVFHDLLEPGGLRIRIQNLPNEPYRQSVLVAWGLLGLFKFRDREPNVHAIRPRIRVQHPLRVQKRVDSRRVLRLPGLRESLLDEPGKNRGVAAGDAGPCGERDPSRAHRARNNDLTQPGLLLGIHDARGDPTPLQETFRKAALFGHLGARYPKLVEELLLRLRSERHAAVGQPDDGAVRDPVGEELGNLLLHLSRFDLASKALGVEAGLAHQVTPPRGSQRGVKLDLAGIAV